MLPCSKCTRWSHLSCLPTSILDPGKTFLCSECLPDLRPHIENLNGRHDRSIGVLRSAKEEGLWKYEEKERRLGSPFSKPFEFPRSCAKRGIDSLSTPAIPRPTPRFSLSSRSDLPSSLLSPCSSSESISRKRGRFSNAHDFLESCEKNDTIHSPDLNFPSLPAFEAYARECFARGPVAPIELKNT